jgi:NADH-quinone oxidoreductase subunit L
MMNHLPEIAVVFLPLLGALIAGLFGRVIGDRASQIVTCGGLFASAACAIYLFIDVAMHHHVRTVELAPWIQSGGLNISWALRFDTLTAVMLVVVTGVSSMVHLYSVGYMSHDKSIPRFMSYLSLFTFMMLMLVTADNLVQMFFGWEGVGVASYLLINFWFHKPSANDASIKAFLVNRVGDFGFILGIFAVFMLTGSVVFDEVFAAAPALAGTSFHFLSWNVDALTAACLLLFVGAMGKSAQLGLHTWLPDAMEGPTPVSALIHAATMVTAGVFMVARLSPVFEYAPLAREVVTIVGALTAFIAATIGFTQFDIKRVIAYSTMSQLGYMFFALGVSAYSGAIFHLFTHAFFKALLFLGAGSVIHALSGEQDLRKMGGIWKLIPLTYIVMWIGSIALAGVGIPHVFGFAGFYSKDLVLEAAYAAGTVQGHFAYWLGIGAAFLTAFYSWRLLIMAFHGKPHADHDTMHHVHESPPVMLIPLAVLAVGSVLAGFVFHEEFVGTLREHFWERALFVLPEDDSVEAAHHVAEWVKLMPIIVGFLGIFLAWLMYVARPAWPGKLAATTGPVYRLFFNKYYFDELYDRVFVRSSKYLGRVFWQSGDNQLIDGVGPNGLSAISLLVGGQLSRLQTGFVFHYAFAVVAGVVGLVSWLYWH